MSLSPSSPDSHLLRVQSSFIGRRLSDNSLIMPPRIHVNHSSCSSPGDGSLGAFPIRRHSSFGAERRGSTCMNLSPPTVGGGGRLVSPTPLPPLSPALPHSTGHHELSLFTFTLPDCASRSILVLLAASDALKSSRFLINVFMEDAELVLLILVCIKRALLVSYSVLSSVPLPPAPSVCSSVDAKGAAVANTSRSVPMLLTPGSNASSRRPSTCSISSFGGMDSRRSSATSMGSPSMTATFNRSRRPSTLMSNTSSSNLLQQFSSGVGGRGHLRLQLERYTLTIIYQIYLFVRLGRPCHHFRNSAPTSRQVTCNHLFSV
ncbi:hypothetical protein FHG87_000225 [Trinorchestia longiramus]|nr:hypothetical protein FHG87_000225 [Trinorchestia longiramus]